MKIKGLVLASVLSFTMLSANDVMQKSMGLMQDGINKIQQGFINNDKKLIEAGSALVEEGNHLFSEKETISKYFPKDKSHMLNVAENQAKRITLGISVMNLNLDDKSYINATNAYADVLNACSRCHALIRSW